MEAGEPWTHFIREFEVAAPSQVSFSWLGSGKAHQGLLLDNMVWRPKSPCPQPWP